MVHVDMLAVEMMFPVCAIWILLEQHDLKSTPGKPQSPTMLESTNCITAVAPGVGALVVAVGGEEGHTHQVHTS